VEAQHIASKLLTPACTAIAESGTLLQTNAYSSLLSASVMAIQEVAAWKWHRGVRNVPFDTAVVRSLGVCKISVFRLALRIAVLMDGAYDRSPTPSEAEQVASNQLCHCKCCVYLGHCMRLPAGIPALDPPYTQTNLL
jgi:hypothetical protein